MDAQTKRRYGQDYADQLARASLAGYARGRRAVVARALGVSPTRLSHLTTDDVHPTLQGAFRVLLDLTAVDDAAAQAFLEAVQAAVEARPLLTADRATLEARRAFLKDRENDLEAAENRAAYTGDGYSPALRAEAWLQLELAANRRHPRHRSRRVSAPRWVPTFLPVDGPPWRLVDPRTGTFRKDARGRSLRFPTSAAAEEAATR